MAFNSINFLIFFIIVYALYLILAHRWQNWLLLVASYIFYGSWDWRFIPLLLLSTWISYYSGIKISSSTTKKGKLDILKMSLVAEIFLLIVFKYFNFFTDNFIGLLHLLGVPVEPIAIKILLPLGISYYTFQAIAYTIDVYKESIPVCRNFWDFALFKSFFPILFSGPIERASNLIPQIQKKRSLNISTLETGLFLVGWGLVKKIYISDNVGPVVSLFFKNSSNLNGVETWIATYGFAIQLYCDFSGYTDIARGLANLLGFNLVLNFNLPYFAQNPAEFWRRWHMSLSNWFMDYVYKPLFFKIKKFKESLLVTFFLIGLWHGASWNFALLGLYNGIIIILYLSLKPYFRLPQSLKSKGLGPIAAVLSGLLTFHLISLGFLFFRSESLRQSQELITHIFTGPFEWTPFARDGFAKLLFFAAPLFIMEVFQLKKGDIYAFLKTSSKVRFASSLAILYLMLLVYLFTGNVGHTGQFIYFQF